MKIKGIGAIAVFALLLGWAAAVSAASAADKAFLWDGTHWTQVSAEGKAGYIFGLGNLADFEIKASRGKGACVSLALAEGLKSMTVAQVVQEVDKFFQENPDKLKTSVIEVILRRCAKVCPPEAKSGDKKK